MPSCGVLLPAGKTSRIKISEYYNSFYRHWDMMETRKKSSTYRKHWPRILQERPSRSWILNNRTLKGVTAICLNCPTCHVREEKNSVMQFSKCKTKQNNKIARLSDYLFCILFLQIRRKMERKEIPESFMQKNAPS